MTIEYDDWELEGETVRMYLSGEEVAAIDISNIVFQWLGVVEKMGLYKEI